MMRTLFNDAAVFHNQNDICLLNGGEPVGNNKAGAVFHELGKAHPESEWAADRASDGRCKAAAAVPVKDSLLHRR